MPYPKRAAVETHPTLYTGLPMGDWYTIGILVGLGASIGLAFTGLLRRLVPALVASVAVAVAIGFAFGQWDEAVGGAVGAICAALVGAALAFVPIVGYLEALAIPALGLRLRRRSPDRHAGLRSLARD